MSDVITPEEAPGKNTETFGLGTFRPPGTAALLFGALYGAIIGVIVVWDVTVLLRLLRLGRDLLGRMPESRSG
jgi:hypothetical protein